MNKGILILGMGRNHVAFGRVISVFSLSAFFSDLGLARGRLDRSYFQAMTDFQVFWSVFLVFQQQGGGHWQGFWHVQPYQQVSHVWEGLLHVQQFFLVTQQGFQWDSQISLLLGSDFQIFPSVCSIVQAGFSIFSSVFISEDQASFISGFSSVSELKKKWYMVSNLLLMLLLMSVHSSCDFILQLIPYAFYSRSCLVKPSTKLAYFFWSAVILCALVSYTGRLVWKTLLQAISCERMQLSLKRLLQPSLHYIIQSSQLETNSGTSKTFSLLSCSTVFSPCLQLMVFSQNWQQPLSSLVLSHSSRLQFSLMSQKVLYLLLRFFLISARRKLDLLRQLQVMGSFRTFFFLENLESFFLASFSSLVRRWSQMLKSWCLCMNMQMPWCFHMRSSLYLRPQPSLQATSFIQPSPNQGTSKCLSLLSSSKLFYSTQLYLFLIFISSSMECRAMDLFFANLGSLWALGWCCCSESFRMRLSFLFFSPLDLCSRLWCSVCLPSSAMSLQSW